MSARPWGSCGRGWDDRVDPAQLVALGIGVLGVAGIIFTALRYNRDDTTAIINQQATITAEMKTLNDELRLTVARLREERDALTEQVAELRALVKHSGYE